MKPRNFAPLLTAVSVLAACCVLAIGLHTAAATLRAWDPLAAVNPFRLARRVAPTGPVVLEQVQRLQRLETSRYNGQVIVRGDTGGWLPTWLAGDRLLFIAQGEVVAGVDLARLTASDVTVEGETLRIRLPAAEVLHTRLDNHRSQVHERRAGIFTGPDAQLETRVRQEAEERLRAAALEGGLLASAEEHGREALRRQLGWMGFREVVFL